MIQREVWHNVVAQRRMGRMAIPNVLLESHTSGMAAIFTRFVPVAIQPGEQEGTAIYIGYSPDFAPLNEDDVIPFYIAQIKESLGIMLDAMTRVDNNGGGQ